MKKGIIVIGVILSICLCTDAVAGHVVENEELIYAQKISHLIIGGLSLFSAIIFVLLLACRHKRLTDKYYYQREKGEDQLKMELAIKASNIMQWDYDCQMRMFRSVNESIGNDRGYITPQEYCQITHPDDQQIIKENIREMDLRQKDAFSFDVRMGMTASGQWRHVTIDGVSVRDSNNNVIKYTGFRKDNTKFVLLNDQLRSSNAYLNMVLQASEIYPAVLDVASNCVYVSSGGGLEFLNDKNKVGVSFESYLANIHPDDREPIRKMFEDIKSGVIEAGHQECRYDVYSEYRKIYDVNYVGVDRDHTGKPIRVVGYLQNITERKRAEANIKRQNEFLNSVIAKIPFPVHIKDMGESGQYIYWNEESSKMFGEGLFRTTQSLLGEERAKKLNEIDQKVFETGIPYTNEERIVMLDGRECDTMVHKSVVCDGDRRLLMIVRWDISQENELQRKSKVLSVSMNALHAFTWYCDLRDGILRYGDGFEQTGANPSEMNSMVKFAEKIHPDYRQSFVDSMTDFCLQDSGDFMMEYAIDLQGNGVYEWWECRGTIDVAQRGGYSYKYMYGIDINIERHKQSESILLKTKVELARLNTQNEMILNNTNSGLVFIDNEFVVQWENLSSFLPNHPMTQNFHKGGVCYQAKEVEDVLCEECVVQRSMLSGQIEMQEIETSPQTVELTAMPIYNDVHERIGTVLKVVDITESKRVHLELEAAKNRAEGANVLMTNIIECLPCLLFIKDAEDDYRHIVANRYFCDVLGLPVDQIIGKTDYDLFPTPEEAQRCRLDDRMAVEQNRLHIYEEETTFQGRRIIWQTTKASVRTVDGRVLLIGISLDITAKMLAYDQLQEAKERAEQSNLLKSAFLANMSHEIRTPLNAIVGFSELMKDASEPQEKEEYVRIINTNNELLLRLINDILDLSKIEAGMMELKPGQFDVVELFKELSSMFEKRITNSDVDFICDNPYESCIVSLDKGRFTQIITNFMTNAIKFTLKGEIRIGYEYVNGGLRTYVMDSGIGIAKDKIDKVFERFEKLDDFAQGTGLGMAICKAIVEAHNGKIGVDSEQGKGATFWMWLPIEPQIGYKKLDVV